MAEFPWFYIVLIIGYIWMINSTVGPKARREWRAFGRRQRGKPRYEYLLRYNRLHQDHRPPTTPEPEDGG